MSTPASPWIVPASIASLREPVSGPIVPPGSSRTLRVTSSGSTITQERTVNPAMSHAESKSNEGSAIELRIEVAPDVGLHVERREGDPAATPFVLVHGLASNLRLWDGVAEHLLSRGHTVVALDQRGHGRSDAPESGYD